MVEARQCSKVRYRDQDDEEVVALYSSPIAGIRAARRLLEDGEKILSITVGAAEISIYPTMFYELIELDDAACEGVLGTLCLACATSSGHSSKGTRKTGKQDRPSSPANPFTMDRLLRVCLLPEGCDPFVVLWSTPIQEWAAAVSHGKLAVGVLLLYLSGKALCELLGGPLRYARQSFNELAQ
jgi:hypothetical protein